jgi:hypothetical protein
MGSFQPFPTEPPLALSADLRRDGARLFDVSMWLLGCDVRHADNLLLRRGFTRERLPQGQEGTSAYSLELEGGAGLTLWGFGALCHAWGERIFVPRDGFAPRLVEGSRVAWPVFQAAGLGPLREPCTPREQGAARAVLGVLAEWLAGHEEWVRETVGLAYRRECVGARRKAAPVPVEMLPEAWRRLAARLRVQQPVVTESSAPAFGA